MPNLTIIVSTTSASFLACFVEVVEAFTIVLAVGITQGWRPAIIGTGAALVVLSGLVIALGPLLGLVPIHLVQYAVGVLLILFGMRWLRKAILRSVGVISLHDEDKAFAEETRELERLARDRRADTLAGIAAFKAVLLEGIEVAFIVIAVGTAHRMTGYAALGAVAALIVVVGLGAALHRPLSQVPENALKFVVGLMLTTFGVFWTGEGIGVGWPGADLSLIGIFLFFSGVSAVLVRLVAKSPTVTATGVAR